MEGLKSIIGDSFIIKDNLLYLVDVEKPRLVIPKPYHQLILQLDSFTLWAGLSWNLGHAKTYKCITKHFC